MAKSPKNILLAFGTNQSNKTPGRAIQIPSPMKVILIRMTRMIRMGMIPSVGKTRKVLIQEPDEEVTLESTPTGT